MVAVLLLPACSQDDDTGPFRLVRSLPFDGQTQVTAWQSLYLFFSQDVRRSTFDDTSVTLTDVTRSQGVPVQIMFFDWWPDHPGRRVVEIRGVLLEATDYRLDVADTVRDVRGQSISAPVSIAFRTADVRRLISPDPQACARWGGGVFCGDINGDGYDDVAVLQSGLVVAFFGPDLISQVSVSDNFAPGRAQPMAGGDFDGDGYVDLAVYTTGWPLGNDYVTVLFGPDLTRSLAVTNPLGGHLGFGITVGDVNDDALADLVATGAGTEIPVLFGPDLAQFAVVPEPTGAGPLGGYASGVAVGDLDGDGQGEVLVSQDGGGSPPTARIFVFSAPTFAAYTLFSDPKPGGEDGGGFTVADATGDAVNDLLLTVHCPTTKQSEILVWEGPDLSRLSRMGRIKADPVPFYADVAVADLNGDQSPDVVASNPSLYSARAYLGPGFDQPLVLADPDQSAGLYWFGFLDTGDVNGDGFADVLIGEPAACGPTDLVEGRAFLFFGP